MTTASHPRSGTANPQSIWAWVAMNYDLSPAAQQKIFVLAINDILGDQDDTSGCSSEMPLRDA